MRVRPRCNVSRTSGKVVRIDPSRCASSAITLGANSGREVIAMKADDLRALQAPLEERYKETPEAALVTLRAQGRAGEGGKLKDRDRKSPI